MRVPMLQVVKAAHFIKDRMGVFPVEIFVCGEPTVSSVYVFYSKGKLSAYVSVSKCWAFPEPYWAYRLQTEVRAFTPPWLRGGK